MSAWEQSVGASDEWYTPEYIFDALGLTFDLDVASPPRHTHVPCRARLTSGGLDTEWRGLVWMNPPFGGRNGLVPWLDKFFAHGNGIALTPDRTSAPWWQAAARNADAILFIDGKVKFERPDGSVGKQPGTGTTLMSTGPLAFAALRRAQIQGLGFLAVAAAILPHEQRAAAMSRRYVTLGDGRQLTLGSYVAVVKAAKSSPASTFPRSLCDWWPANGAEIVRQFREGMHERVSRAIPYQNRKGM